MFTRPINITQSGTGATIIPVSRFNASTVAQIAVAGTATWELKWSLDGETWADHPDGALNGSGAATARFSFPVAALRLEVTSGDGSASAIVVATRGGGRASAAAGGGGGDGFDPATLFGVGVLGGWYDPSDLSTLYSDDAGTTPAVVDGPVGRMEDKSGNGLHLTQSISGGKPTLRQDGDQYYLEFDGVNDYLRSGVADHSSIDAMNIVAGVRKTHDDVNSRSLFAWRDGANPGFRLRTSSNLFTILNTGSSSVNVSSAASYAPATGTHVVSCVTAGGASPDTQLIIDRADPYQSASNPNYSNHGSGNFMIGAETTFPAAPFEGRCYGLIMWSGAAVVEDIQNAEDFIASKSGVTL